MATTTVKSMPKASATAQAPAPRDGRILRAFCHRQPGASLGFGVCGFWGLGFMVWGLGFGVLGFGVWGLGFMVWGLGLGVLRSHDSDMPGEVHGS